MLNVGLVYFKINMTYVIGINKKYLFLDDTDYVKHHGGCGSLKEQNIFVCKLTGK
jgi:hypothetical protein